MPSDKQSAQLLLFPLCDRHGELLKALIESQHKTGTRADSLVFAWMLGLPRRVSQASAATAIITVFESGLCEQKSARQEAILHTLRGIVIRHHRHANKSVNEQPADWKSVLRSSRRRIPSSEVVRQRKTRTRRVLLDS